MTIDEAIEELKTIYAFCNTEPIFQDAINKVIHNHVKYRWHDLRKDPEDLPNYKNDVEVVMLDGTHCFMFLDFSIEKNERRWYSSYPYEGEDQSLFYIRAWREIEPFEEVE